MIKTEKQYREPLTKKETRNLLIQNEIKVRGKRAYCTHYKYDVIVRHIPEAKKYFIFQLELDF